MLPNVSKLSIGAPGDAGEPSAKRSKPSLKVEVLLKEDNEYEFQHAALRGDRLVRQMLLESRGLGDGLPMGKIDVHVLDDDSCTRKWSQETPQELSSVAILGNNAAYVLYGQLNGQSNTLHWLDFEQQGPPMVYSKPSSFKAPEIERTQKTALCLGDSFLIEYLKSKASASVYWHTLGNGEPGVELQVPESTDAKVQHVFFDEQQVYIHYCTPCTELAGYAGRSFSKHFLCEATGAAIGGNVELCTVEDKVHSPPFVMQVKENRAVCVIVPQHGTEQQEVHEWQSQPLYDDDEDEVDYTREAPEEYGGGTTALLFVRNLKTFETTPTWPLAALAPSKGRRIEGCVGVDIAGDHAAIATKSTVVLFDIRAGQVLGSFSPFGQSPSHTLSAIVGYTKDEGLVFVDDGGNVRMLTYNL